MQMVKNFLKDTTNEEKMILAVAASIFLQFYLTAAVLVFLFLRVVLIKDIRKEVLKGTDFKLALIFIPLNIIAPIYFKNYLGLACFFGVFAILILCLYFRSFMNEMLFIKVCDVIAFFSMTSAIVARLQKIDPKFRSASVFFNANYYGTIITFVILICVYRLLTKNANIGFMLITIAFNFYGLLQADCQSAFFSIALGVWLLLLFTKKYKTFAFLSVLLAIGLIFISKLTFIMPRITDAFENIMLRSKIWSAGIRAFLETPFIGRGMMGYLQIYKEFGGPKNYHCHNLFIDMLLSFGVLGSIPLVAFVTRNVKAAFKKKFSPLFFSVALAILLHSMVDVTIFWIQTGALLAILLSAAYIKE